MSNTRKSVYRYDYRRSPDQDAPAVAVEARRNLTDAQAAELDARLVLILANHVGDLGVLREAIALAKESS